MTLAEQIRARLEDFDGDYSRSEALLAVLDQCDRMREDARHNAIGNTIWVDALVGQFESVIARELGIDPQESR